MTETSYKYVVFGTAAKNLKGYHLWIRFHTNLPSRVQDFTDGYCHQQLSMIMFSLPYIKGKDEGIHNY